MLPPKWGNKSAILGIVVQIFSWGSLKKNDGNGGIYLDRWVPGSNYSKNVKNEGKVWKTEKKQIHYQGPSQKRTRMHEIL